MDCFRMLARYNRIANERLYEKCAELDIAEYGRGRRGSFGSLHSLLNHILLGDQIWMARFVGGGSTTPPLDSILFESFAELRSARVQRDARIEMFFEKVENDFLSRAFPYTNHEGKHYFEAAPVAVLLFFNHQTHHRGQAHAQSDRS